MLGCTVRAMKTRLLATVCAAAALLAAAACGGGGGGRERALTVDDMISALGPVPDTPAGAAYSTDSQATTLTPDDLRTGATQSDRPLVDALSKAGLSKIYQRSFHGAFNTADGTAYVFPDATGAGTAFDALHRSLSKTSDPSQKLAEEKPGSLGDQAWGAHLTGGSEGALFLWRRSNVVIVADMSCDSGCGVDIVAAARDYAAAIDQRTLESLQQS